MPLDKKTIKVTQTLTVKLTIREQTHDSTLLESVRVTVIVHQTMGPFFLGVKSFAGRGRCNERSNKVQPSARAAEGCTRDLW